MPLMTETPVKLNLGCGHKHFPQEEGWVNVDYEYNSAHKKPDVSCDIRYLPFEDNYADELHAIHAIEHLYVWDAIEALRNEWQRVLKPSGLLVLEMPCMDKVLELFKEPDIHHRATWWALYGDPRTRDPHMAHKWCWSLKMIQQALTDLGWKDITQKEPQFHFKDRDMRIEARKETDVNNKED